MTDYDLNRLGPLEFEHLIQALAGAEFGVSVSIFGAGPDGGREATFHGSVPGLDFLRPLHPSDPTPYGVVQAKTQRWSVDAQDDGKKVNNAARAELDKFVAQFGEKEPKRKRKPDFYIVATNSRLTPTNESGTLDLVEKTLGEHAVGLRGYAVWHYERICRLLEKHGSVRRAFAGFITPGDVLEHVMEMLGAGSPATVAPILKQHAATQIAAREKIKLESADIDGRTETSLSAIGIDLSARDESGKSVEVVRKILEAGDRSLRGSHSDPSLGTFVIVGGPGQGKSTLGQIVCQSYRYALVSELSRSTPSIETAIRQTAVRLRTLGLPVPNNRRWPFFLELATYAKQLALDPSVTVTEFIASQLIAQQSQVTRAQMGAWLANWPWVLILDGLDEVPASGDRDLVMGQLNAFVTEVRIQDWDVLLVCTTRPQGYANEFSEFDPSTLELAPLSVEKAVSYGKNLVRVRYPEDKILGNQIVAKLRNSARSPHAARLMTTPLQVTIMTILLEKLNEVPSTRHELFDGYYRAIYGRESIRPGPLAHSLKLYHEQIDWVHERVAFTLQERAESHGKARTSIAANAIRNLFHASLTRDGYDPEETARISVQLETASRHRLVLLVPSGIDEVAFEVQSLQEYMAARSLASGAVEDVLERIGHLAPSAYWRHTVRLTLGRVYANRPQDRDTLINALVSLDTEDVTSRFLSYGAQIATDLLRDDFAVSKPVHRRLLLSHALTQLSIWPTVGMKHLSGLCRSALNGDDSAAATLVETRLREALNSLGPSRIGATYILREMRRSNDRAAAFGRRTLAEPPTNIQPDFNSEIKFNPSVATAFDAATERADLDERETSIYSGIRNLLHQTRLPELRTMDEAVGRVGMTRNLESTLWLETAFKQEGAIRVLAKIAPHVHITDAAAPMLVRQALIQHDQRIPRTTDSFALFSEPRGSATP